MSKPTQDVHFASADINNIEFDGTLKDDGYATDEIPTSAGMNWWMNAIGEFVIWLASWFDSAGHLLELDHIVDADYNLLEGLAPITIHEFPLLMWGSNLAADDQLVSGDGSDNPAWVSSGSGAGYFALDVPEGYRLKNVVLRCKGDGSLSFAISIRSLPAATGGSTIIHQGPNLSGLSATPADQTLKVYANRGAGTSVVVGGSVGTRTYTRTVGSWVTDNFEIGQHIDVGGFSNSANNVSLALVTAISATMLTTNDGSGGGITSPVIETSSAGTFETVDSEVDDTKHMALLWSFGGTAMGISHLRYTYARVP